MRLITIILAFISQASLVVPGFSFADDFLIAEEELELESEHGDPYRDSIDLPIIKHYRGNSGIPFQTVSRKPSGPPLLRKAKEQIGLIASSIARWHGTSSISGSELPACTKDRTEHFEIGLADTGLRHATFLDTLFIEEKNLPRDAKQSFGESTDLRTYRPDIGNRAFHTARLFGVHCLPARVILNGKSLTRHFGKPALRNYNKIK